MREVWKARDIRLDRTVAIKIPPEQDLRQAPGTGTIRARSSGSFQPEPPAHLHPARRRSPGKALTTSGDGVSGRRNAGPETQEADAGTGIVLRHRDRGRTRPCAPARSDPPRSKARQHHADQFRGKSGRFRTGEGAVVGCAPTAQITSGRRTRSEIERSAVFRNRPSRRV